MARWDHSNKFLHRVKLNLLNLKGEILKNNEESSLEICFAAQAVEDRYPISIPESQGNMADRANIEIDQELKQQIYLSKLSRKFRLHHEQRQTYAMPYSYQNAYENSQYEEFETANCAW